jgi:hypothetical protein
VATVGKLVQKYERDSYIQKEKQYTKMQNHRIHKIENKKKTNKNTKQENKHKKYQEKISRVIRE